MWLMLCSVSIDRPSDDVDFVTLNAFGYDVCSVDLHRADHFVDYPVEIRVNCMS